jgi:crotonobetainyl-CoA:carnitine CoA-transferase CaiB-like acyl-CoA transferase
VTVRDEDLGDLRMQNQLFRLSGAPTPIRWAGRRHGHDTAAVLRGIGVTPDELADLRARGIA